MPFLLSTKLEVTFFWLFYPLDIRQPAYEYFNMCILSLNETSFRIAGTTQLKQMIQQCYSFVDTKKNNFLD